MTTLEQEIMTDAASVAAQANGTWEELMTDFTVAELVAPVKEGEKDGKPWKRFGALLVEEDGDKPAVWGGTFDKEIGAKLLALKGQPATIKAEQKGEFWNIVAVEGATAEAAAPVQAASNETGYRKTLSQQLSALYGTDAAVTALLTGEPEQVLAYQATLDSAARHNAVIVMTEEMPKTDEDVPF